MLINCIKCLFLLGYPERMSIRARMIIIYLSIIPHFGITKKSDLTFILFNSVQLKVYHMVVTMYVHAFLWHDDIRACTIMVFVPYPLRKFRLTPSFYY